MSSNYKIRQFTIGEAEQNGFLNVSLNIVFEPDLHFMQVTGQPQDFTQVAIFTLPALY